MTMPPTGLDESDPVKRVFAPLVGLPAWGVQKGHGSMLTFEFGEPSLQIREPINTSAEASPRTSASLARRKITPRGEWHLWIYCCNWRCTANGIEIARSDSADADIAAAAAELDSQRLLAVTVEPHRGRSTFMFDLGGLLETSPYDDGEDEQWLVYRRSGDVFAYRADGHYSWGPPDKRPEDEVWLPLTAAPA